MGKRMCADIDWHSAGSMGWPFPMLSLHYKYIFQVKHIRNYGQWRRNYGDRGYIVSPSSGFVPPVLPSQRCGLCQNFMQMTLTTRLYKVRTHLYPHLRKRSDAPDYGTNFIKLHSETVMVWQMTNKMKTKFVSQSICRRLENRLDSGWSGCYYSLLCFHLDHVVSSSHIYN